MKITKAQLAVNTLDVTSTALMKISLHTIWNTLLHCVSQIRTQNI